MMAACSSGPKIYVNKDPNTNLGSFTTFGFSPKLGTDRDEGAQTLLSQFFIEFTRDQMELRGYKYTDKNPEIEINFYVSTKEKIRTTSTPTAGGYYGFRGGYYGAYGGYDTTIQQYTEGTVTVDLVNNSTDKLVWEGTAIGRITSEVDNNLREAVSVVVIDIFKKYPTQSGGGGPYIPPKK
jgi:hypothetical protein